MPIEKNLEPGQKWAFDAEVTDNFDDMLVRSIPEYESMRRVVADVAQAFVRPYTSVVDLGASRGVALDQVRREWLARGVGNNHELGVMWSAFDESVSMVEACERRFEGVENVDVRRLDLRKLSPYQGLPCVQLASVVLSVLTLQFVPVEFRARIVGIAYRTLVRGGAFVLVEKVLGSSEGTQDTLVDLYHALKVRNGYSPEEVEAKRRSLEGVLVPMQAIWNEELLREAGFDVEPIWAAYNFRAWLAVKP